MKDEHTADYERDWEGIAAALADESQRLQNVVMAARQHLRDGEGHLAMQVLDQVWAELIDG